MLLRTTPLKTPMRQGGIVEREEDEEEAEEELAYVKKPPSSSFYRCEALPKEDAERGRDQK